jgi:hypothetical protein
MTDDVATIDVEIEGMEPVVVVDSSDSIPARLEQAREIFRLKLAGQTYDQIAGELSISRSSVIRRLEEYRADYAEQLIQTPRKHLLGEELARLDSIENEARKCAEKSSTDGAKNAFLKTALTAICKRQALLLDSGIIPREPAKLLTAHVLPEEEALTKHPDERSDEEVQRDIMELLKRGRRI